MNKLSILTGMTVAAVFAFAAPSQSQQLYADPVAAATAQFDVESPEGLVQDVKFRGHRGFRGHHRGHRSFKGHHGHKYKKYSGHRSYGHKKYRKHHYKKGYYGHKGGVTLNLGSKGKFHFSY